MNEDKEKNATTVLPPIVKGCLLFSMVPVAVIVAFFTTCGVASVAIDDPLKTSQLSILVALIAGVVAFFVVLFVVLYKTIGPPR